jgi:hypothetical protein
MDWLKLDKDGELIFNSEEVKLVPEVQELMSLKYNKGPKDNDGRKRYKALAELKYMYLVYSPKSPYKDYYEKERIEEAKLDCAFPDGWTESPELRAVIAKYMKGSVSKITRSLKTVEKFLEKFEKHLNDIDLNERTGGGTLVHDPAKVMTTLGKLPDFLTTIHELERAAKNDIIAAPSSKGDHELGLLALNKNINNRKQRDDESEEDIS